MGLSMEGSEFALAPQWLTQGNQRHSSRFTNGFSSGDRFTEAANQYRPSSRARLWDSDWSKDRRSNDLKDRCFGYDDRDRGFGFYRPRLDSDRRPHGLFESGDRKSGGGGGIASGAHRGLPVSDNHYLSKPVQGNAGRLSWRTDESTASDLEICLAGPPKSKAALEFQRSEELALKQSRLLIPMVPSPKTTGVVSRDKVKPKPTEVVNPRLSQIRTPAAPSVSKSSSGKLLVLSKESIQSARPSSANAAKQLVDRRAVPIAVDHKPKNGLAVNEDRKPAVGVQNRNDFFDTLRRKSAASGENRGPQENGCDKQERSVASGVELDKGCMNIEPEERALLTSMGWVEAQDEPPLTEEEIVCFIRKHFQLLSERWINALLDSPSPASLLLNGLLVGGEHFVFKLGLGR